MVNSKQYYDRKNAGLCTKCAAPLGDSPSSVRCAACHARFKEGRKKRKQARNAEGACIQCGTSLQSSDSNRCESCKAKSQETRRANTPQTISKYNESNTACRLCNSPIDTLGIVCQECLANKVFTLQDALVRYGASCSECLTEDTSILRLVSSRIEEPMPLRGADLYKTVCFSMNAPPDYTVMCHPCYRDVCISYVQQLRGLFMSGGQP